MGESVPAVSPPSSHSVFGAPHVYGKPLGKEPPRYRPTPASRTTVAPQELSWRATGATSTQCPGAASTTAPAGCAASPWGPCGYGEGEGTCCSPRSCCLAPRTHGTRGGSATCQHQALFAQCQAHKKKGEHLGGPAPPGSAHLPSKAAQPSTVLQAGGCQESSAAPCKQAEHGHGGCCSSCLVVASRLLAWDR